MSMLTPKDIEVLNIMWGEKDAMLASDIGSKNGLAPSTLGAVIRKLCTNGLIDVAGVSYLYKAPARTYRPLPKSKDEVIEYMLDEMDKVKNIVSLEELLEAKKSRER